LCEWPKEGIPIPRLFQTQDGGDVNAILLLETYLWREIVVEQDDRPTCLIMPLEWRKSICRKAESNITWVGEEEKRIGIISRNDRVE
jgi:hypothetical protein